MISAESPTRVAASARAADTVVLPTPPFPATMVTRGAVKNCAGSTCSLRRLRLRTLASRRVALAVLFLCVGGMSAVVQSALAAGAGAATGCERDGCVHALEVSGLIDPIIIRFVDDEVAEAEATPGVVGVVLELDSPGVVVDDATFQDFVDGLVNADVPVSAWVGTGGEASGGGAGAKAGLAT